MAEKGISASFQWTKTAQRPEEMPLAARRNEQFDWTKRTIRLDETADSNGRKNTDSQQLPPRKSSSNPSQLFHSSTLTQVPLMMKSLKINPEGVSKPQAGVLTPANGRNATQALKGRQNTGRGLDPCIEWQRHTNPEGVTERKGVLFHPFGVRTPSSGNRGSISFHPCLCSYVPSGLAPPPALF